MKCVGNIACFLIILVGFGFIAWLQFEIVAESYITMIAGADLGFTRPRIVITSPTSDVVSQPMIQIVGYYPREIQKITFDITNATGANKTQLNSIQEGYVTDRFFDKVKWNRMTQELSSNRFKPWKPGLVTEQPESAFTTNFFQIYDVNLAKGKNRIAIHVRDVSGRQYSTKRFYTLDFSSDKIPPVIKLIWPQDKSKISGKEFELNAQVDDNNATIKTTIKDSNGKIHTATAIVERNGIVWVKGLPVSPGINEVAIVATDAAGNSSTNNFSVSKASVTVTMQPLENSQLNKPLVNVKGTVSDARCIVEVNDVKATVHPDGTWDAKDVPVSPTGTASFNINIFPQ
jgi:hypothetical protein